MRRLLLVPLVILLGAAGGPAPNAAGGNDFTLDLYQRLRKKPGNLAVGPASIDIALAMTLGGARNSTAEQMRKVLHAGGPPAEIMARGGAVMKTLESSGEVG